MTRRTLALSGLIPLLMLTACGGDASRAPAPEAPAIRAAVSEARRLTLPRTQAIAGTIRAREQATVGARVLAAVLSADFAVGARVQAGSLLVVLDGSEFEARVQQAEASRDLAVRDHERESRLLAEGVSTAESVRALQDRRRMAESALAEARALASHTRIRAPFDGVVLARHVNAGDLAIPGAPLFVIESAADLRAEIEVPEALPLLARGTEVPIVIGSRTLAGILDEMSPGSDAASRTRLAKVLLPEDSGALPGQFVRAQWPAGSEEAVIVPGSSLSRSGQIERVFTVEDGRARLRIVRSAGEAGGGVRIASGLDGGERIVLDAPAGLRDGVRVEPEA